MRVLKGIFLVLIYLMVALNRLVYSSEAEFITYEWLITLAKKTAYTDHIPHFRRLFNSMKVRGFLECGCGFSTKFFLDHCDKVISIEFLTPGNDDQWLQQCLKLYQGIPNWVPCAYNADHARQSFNAACAYQCSMHKDYALIDSRYLSELAAYFDMHIRASQLEGNIIDVAFVDPGVYTRGDMVKVLLAHEVPVVVAHDTASDVGSDVDEGLYGWFKVQTPKDYEKIHIPFGMGTTFWIHKSLPHVIQSIQSYRELIVQLPHEEISYEMLVEFADSHR